MVTALALAVLFVALALLLNTAIYTENLATRTSGVDDHAAVEMRSATDRGLGGTLHRINRENDSDYTTLEDALERAVGNLSDQMAVHKAAHVGGVNVSTLRVDRGTRVAHVDDTREFTNRSGARNWTAGVGIDELRRFEFNVSRSSLGDAGVLGLLSDAFFRIEVSNGDTWRAFVFDDGGQVSVKVQNGTAAPISSGACKGPTGPDGANVEVDLLAGTVAGKDCALLDYGRGVASPHELGFVNADRARGTYGFVVNQTESTFTAPLPASQYETSAGSGSPFVTEGIYATSVRLTYLSDTLRYTTQIQVAPGESDD